VGNSEVFRILLDAQIRQDTEFIESRSDHVVIDLGVFHHIVTKRDWDGPNKFCTTVPVRWLAVSSKLGIRTIMESLDRLESWGIIYRIKTPKYTARLYKYNTSRINMDKLSPSILETVVHEDLSLVEEEKELVDAAQNRKEKEEEEVVQPVKRTPSKETQRTNTVTNAPPSEIEKTPPAVEEKPVIRVLELEKDYYTGTDYPRWVGVEYDADIASQMPKCGYCLSRYNPTKAGSDKEGMCAECAVVYKLLENEYTENKQEDLHVTVLPHIEDIVFPTMKEVEEFRKYWPVGFGLIRMFSELGKKYHKMENRLV